MGMAQRTMKTIEVVFGGTLLRMPIGVLPVAGGGGGGGNNEISVVQPNAFSNGQAVYFNGATWELAKSDVDTTLGLGILTNVTGAGFTVVFSGVITAPDPYPLEALGAPSPAPLTPGQYYFVSSTVAGALTLTEPTGASEYSNPLLFAVSTSSTEALVLPFRPSAVASSSGGVLDPMILAPATYLTHVSSAAKQNGLGSFTLGSAFYVATAQSGGSSLKCLGVRIWTTQAQQTKVTLWRTATAAVLATNTTLSGANTWSDILFATPYVFSASDEGSAFTFGAWDTTGTNYGCSYMNGVADPGKLPMTAAAPTFNGSVYWLANNPGGGLYYGVGDAMPTIGDSKRFLVEPILAF